MSDVLEVWVIRELKGTSIIRNTTDNIKLKYARTSIPLKRDCIELLKYLSKINDIKPLTKQKSKLVVSVTRIWGATLTIFHNNLLDCICLYFISLI